MSEPTHPERTWYTFVGWDPEFTSSVESGVIYTAVYVDGEPCELTHQEFSLLQELAQNIDRPVSRQELLRDAWGYVCPGETRTVDVHIQRLRKKLGFFCIETVYRRGYKLRAQEVCWVSESNETNQNSVLCLDSGRRTLLFDISVSFSTNDAWFRGQIVWQ